VIGKQDRLEATLATHFAVHDEPTGNLSLAEEIGSITAAHASRLDKADLLITS
jgi:hypothetical protein